MFSSQTILGMLSWRAIHIVHCKNAQKKIPPHLFQNRIFREDLNDEDLDDEDLRAADKLTEIANVTDVKAISGENGAYFHENWENFGNLQSENREKIHGNFHEVLPEPKLLTWAAKEKIKFLHNEDPKEWTPEKLSRSFPASVEAIKKILCSSYVITDEEKIRKHDLKVAQQWKKLGVSGGPIEYNSTEKANQNLLSPSPDKAKSFEKKKRSEFTGIIRSYCKPSNVPSSLNKICESQTIHQPIENIRRNSDVDCQYKKEQPVTTKKKTKNKKKL